LDNGVRLLGLSTRTVLLLVSTIGVIIGGYALVRVERLPKAAKIMMASMSAYGVIAFLSAVASDLPFQSLFSGESFWRGLPLLFQGAVIGGLIVLPLALVATVTRFGMKHPVQGSIEHQFYQAIAMTMSIAIVLAALPQRASLREAATSLEPPVAQSANLAGSGVDNAGLRQPDPLQLLRKADQLTARIAPEEWDVNAKAYALGAGIDAPFLFVRDTIRYEPYAGVLRGASGTYTTRAGNAVDRALLLAYLLAQKDIPTRFAIGTLSEDARERLFQYAFAGPVTNTRGLPPIEEGQQFHQRLLRRAGRDYNVVRAALGSALRPVTRPTREEVLAEMNPHVWVTSASRWEVGRPRSNLARRGSGRYFGRCSANRCTASSGALPTREHQDRCRASVRWQSDYFDAVRELLQLRRFARHTDCSCAQPGK
jgi:hypothetical protein